MQKTNLTNGSKKVCFTAASLLSDEFPVFCTGHLLNMEDLKKIIFLINIIIFNKYGKFLYSAIVMAPL